MAAVYAVPLLDQDVLTSAEAGARAVAAAWTAPQPLWPAPGNASVLADLDYLSPLCGMPRATMLGPSTPPLIRACSALRATRAPPGPSARRPFSSQTASSRQAQRRLPRWRWRLRPALPQAETAALESPQP